MKKIWILALVVFLVVLGLTTFYFSNKSYEGVAPRKGPIVEAIYGLGTVVSRNIFELKLGVTSSVKKVYVAEGKSVDKGAPMMSFYEGTSFQSPFDGVVTSLQFHQGENVPPNVPILRIEDLLDRYIEVSLEQEGAIRVKKGQAVRVVFESVQGQVMEGRVSSLFPRKGEFIAQIDVPDLDKSILPGMTADVSIEVGRIEEALLIPVSSIHSGFVVIRREGKRIKQQVKIGHVDGLWAEVTDGSIRLEDEILIRSDKSRK